MMPYNYIDLLALGENESRTTGQSFHLGPHPEQTPRETIHDPSREKQPYQIQVNSTFDADIVLRRVIEDRAAILALKSRAAVNEAELIKAKTRQRLITKVLDRQDQEISNLTTKAKRELVDYNEKCKMYIRSFMFAFEHGDMDKLPQHPFEPSLGELEQAINQRRATLIEKVQSDDRVKKLQLIKSRERVVAKVLKKNEESFLRAIELSKQQFSDSCGAWRSRVNTLLTNIPRHAQDFGNFNYTMAEHRPQVTAPRHTSRFLPHTKYDGTSQYRYNQPDIAQDSKQPQHAELVTPEPDGTLKRLIGHVSQERDANREVGNFQPMRPRFPGKAERDLQPEVVQDESAGNKKQKMERQQIPDSNPVTSHNESSGADLYSNGCDVTHQYQPSGADPKDDKNGITHHIIHGQDVNNQLSMARILTSLQGDNI